MKLIPTGEKSSAYSDVGRYLNFSLMASLGICFALLFVFSAHALNLPLPEKNPLRSTQQEIKISADAIEKKMQALSMRLREMETLYAHDLKEDEYTGKLIKTKISNLRKTLRVMRSRLDAHHRLVKKQQHKKHMAYLASLKQEKPVNMEVKPLRADEYVSAKHNIAAGTLEKTNLENLAKSARRKIKHRARIPKAEIPQDMNETVLVRSKKPANLKQLRQNREEGSVTSKIRVRAVTVQSVRSSTFNSGTPEPGTRKKLPVRLSPDEKKEWQEITMYLPHKKPVADTSNKQTSESEDTVLGTGRRSKHSKRSRLNARRYNIGSKRRSLENFTPSLPTPKKPHTRSKNKKKYASAEDVSSDIPVSWREDEIQSARNSCKSWMKNRNIQFKYLPPIKKGRCGTPAPLKLAAAGSAKQPVKIVPSATTNCKMAIALDKWFKNSVQPLAVSLFNSPVKSIRNVSSYNCRNRYSRSGGRISEHAYANALDIYSFTLKNGEKISLLDHWDEEGNKSIFLKKLHASACKGPYGFGTVLGPEANAAHKNHFHLDMAKRRRSAYCQ